MSCRVQRKESSAASGCQRTRRTRMPRAWKSLRMHRHVHQIWTESTLIRIAARSMGDLARIGSLRLGPLGTGRGPAESGMGCGSALGRAASTRPPRCRREFFSTSSGCPQSGPGAKSSAAEACCAAVDGGVPLALGMCCVVPERSATACTRSAIPGGNTEPPARVVPGRCLAARRSAPIRNRCASGLHRAADRESCSLR